MLYPVVVHHEEGSSYGVTVPDVPGCFSAGDTYQDALNNASEALCLMIDSIIEDGEDVPIAKSIEHHKKNPEYDGGVWTTLYFDINLHL